MGASHARLRARAPLRNTSGSRITRLQPEQTACQVWSCRRGRTVTGVEVFRPWPHEGPMSSPAAVRSATQPPVALGARGHRVAIELHPRIDLACGLGPSSQVMNGILERPDARQRGLARGERLGRHRLFGESEGTGLPGVFGRDDKTLPHLRDGPLVTDHGGLDARRLPPRRLDRAPRSPQHRVAIAAGLRERPQLVGVLLPGDSENKNRMLMAMIGFLSPKIWKRAAEGSIAQV